MELVNEAALIQRILWILKKGPTDFAGILNSLENIQSVAIQLCLRELEQQGLIFEEKQKFVCSEKNPETLEEFFIPQRHLISPSDLMMLEKFLFRKMGWVLDIVRITCEEYPKCSREVIVSILEDFNIFLPFYTEEEIRNLLPKGETDPDQILLKIHSADKTGRFAELQNRAVFSIVSGLRTVPGELVKSSTREKIKMLLVHDPNIIKETKDPVAQMVLTNINCF
jgi:predicted transcriptional regulator